MLAPRLLLRNFSGWSKLWFSRRQLVREAIKFLRNAAQDLRHVRLDGHFRQLPSMVGFCVVVE